MPSSRKAIFVSAVAALGGFLFGFDTAVINGAVDAIQHHFALSSSLTGVAVACALIGSAVGAWLAGGIADRLGRVRVMVAAAALFTISSLGAGCAFGVWDFIIWRLIAGMGVGVASVIAPAYIAEVAPAHLRGRLGSLQQLAIVTGIFIALLCDATFARAAGSANAELWLGGAAWRWMFIAGVVPSIAYGALAMRLPESPRFLVARGRIDEATRVLAELGTAPDKVAEIAGTVEAGVPPSLRDLRGPRVGLLGIVWIGIALSMLQQLVGINVIFYYSTTLWRSVGLSEADALTITVITSITNIVVTLVAIALVDRLGRRPLLLIGSAGMAVCLAAMAVSFAQAETTTAGALHLIAPYGTIALVAANGYVVFFGVSWGPVVWVLLGEMFPNRIRAAALAVAAAAQWGANFVVTVSFPALASTLGLVASYAIFAGFAALSYGFVARFIRETRGRELEDMHG
ncbi:MAG TPA: sugar porter family MFS transporter [Kofleriaceae bacterium]|jgi:sugar porter (SP) family MFS transporter